MAPLRRAFSSNGNGNRREHRTACTATDTSPTSSRNDLAIGAEPHVAMCLGMQIQTSAASKPSLHSSAHHRPIEITNLDPSSSFPSPTQEAFLSLTMKRPFCLLLQSMMPFAFPSEVMRTNIFPSQERPSTFLTWKMTSLPDLPSVADPLRILFCMIMVVGKRAEHETRKTQMKIRSAVFILFAAVLIPNTSFSIWMPSETIAERE